MESKVKDSPDQKNKSSQILWQGGHEGRPEAFHGWMHSAEVITAGKKRDRAQESQRFNKPLLIITNQVD